ncbi:hypothetical protein DFH06DRAFT_1208237 [Mycena polygramma]|nr:hypothetical protein DFH06DRAFT_1208237 [Mycena polygramma]
MATGSNGHSATSDSDSTPTQTPGSLLSEHSVTSPDENTAMDWTAEDPSPAVAPSSTLKRPSSPGGPAPSKRARQSQYDSSRRAPSRNVGDVGKSPLDTTSEQDLSVADLETSLDSILNHLADETQQRESQLERYASELFNVAPNPSTEAAPSSFLGTPTDFGLDSRDDGSEDELSQSLFDNHFQSLDLGNNSGFSTLTALAAPPTRSKRSGQRRGENKGIVKRFALSAVEDDEMETDSGGPDGEQELNIESQRSHCPCNQCSPTTSAYPEYHPSHDSQAEIHRLFSQSPFAPPMN